MPESVSILRTFTDDAGEYSFTIKGGVIPEGMLAVRISTVSAPPDPNGMRHAVEVGDVGLVVPGFGIIPSLANAIALNALPLGIPALLTPERIMGTLADAIVMNFEPFSVSEVVPGANNANVDHDFLFGDQSVTEKAFWTFDAGITAIRGHNTLPDTPLTTARMAINDLVPALNSMAPPVLQMLLINAKHFDNFDVVIHEYGHFVQHTSEFFPFVPAQYLAHVVSPFGAPAAHSKENLRLEHPGTWREMVNQLAFSEGWASFFSVAAQQTEIDPTSPSSALGNKVVSPSANPLLIPHAVSGDRVIDSQNAENGPNVGEDSESNVTHVLWDLSDPPDVAEPLDRIALGLNGVFALLASISTVRPWPNIWGLGRWENSGIVCFRVCSLWC
jgi:hypothetical protein